MSNTLLIGAAIAGGLAAISWLLYFATLPRDNAARTNRNRATETAAWIFTATAIVLMVLGLFAQTANNDKKTAAPPATGCVDPAGQPGDPAVIDGQGAVCRKMGNGNYGWLLVAPAADNSVKAGGPITDTAAAYTGPYTPVGGAEYDVCKVGADPTKQIEPLVENSQVVPNAFMGLDLNRAEVDSGLRYIWTLAADSYGQYFEPETGLTWEAVGPTVVVASAATVWCGNGGWLKSQGFDKQAGKHRLLNAKAIPQPNGGWVTK